MGFVVCTHEIVRAVRKIFYECGVFMETTATILQLTRGLLILTPAKYDKPEGSGFAVKNKRPSLASTFSVPQIFELNDSLKDHPYEKAEELAAFVKRCAESASIVLGDVFICIEDEDVVITKEYKHAPAKEKLLPTFARVEAEKVLHQDVENYTVLNFEYGQQYGKQNKGREISASLFAIKTSILTDLRAAFLNEGINVVKIVPPIAGMLYTAKSDINSATRVVAVISIDFAATRVVLLHNGAPIFQQSYSSVLEDIAELFSLEFGMSKLGAIDLIRQEGLDLCSRCKSANTSKQVKMMLDTAAQEVVRNIQLVMSTNRVDVDEIVLIDSLAKLQNLNNYCRQIGLTAPLENVTRLFSGGSLPPVSDSAASEKNYDTTSFITLNGVLTMPPAEANLLMGETNILTTMANESTSKIGKMITVGVGVAAAIWMIAVLGWWGALALREKSDNEQLQDPNYVPAIHLIEDEKFWTNQLANVKTNLAMLPDTSLKSADVTTEFLAQVRDKVVACTAFNIDSEKHAISTSVDIDNLDTFVKFKNELVDTGYFKPEDSMSMSTVVDQASSGTNPLQRLRVKLTLDVTEETILAAEEAAAETDNNDSASSGDTGSGEASSTESSDASGASSDSSNA